ncbi:MAG TPA: DUF4332 domain-containing protein [Candidatus Saccharimonadales bacterium]|nr:DUF4332 domain-containing protein [Candidatus Saccharimonadales bacterium]
MIGNAEARDPLLHIPGIGKSLAADLQLLGVDTVEDLKDKNPQELYQRLCELTHSQQDPCVLYAFRCAVYFASGARDPQKLQWWYWKHDRINEG